MSSTTTNRRYSTISLFCEVDRALVAEDGPDGRWITIENENKLTASFSRWRGRELHPSAPLSFAKLPVA